MIHYHAINIFIEYGFIYCLIEMPALKIKDFICNRITVMFSVLAAPVPLFVYWNFYIVANIYYTIHSFSLYKVTSLLFALRQLCTTISLPFALYCAIILLFILAVNMLFSWEIPCYLDG